MYLDLLYFSAGKLTIVPYSSVLQTVCICRYVRYTTLLWTQTWWTEQRSFCAKVLCKGICHAVLLRFMAFIKLALGLLCYTIRLFDPFTLKLWFFFNLFSEKFDLFHSNTDGIYIFFWGGGFLNFVSQPCFQPKLVSVNSTHKFPHMPQVQCILECFIRTECTLQRLQNCAIVWPEKTSSTPSLLSHTSRGESCFSRCNLLNWLINIQYYKLIFSRPGEIQGQLYNYWWS